MLSLVTALLLPACMVTAHAVDRSTLQSAGVAVEAIGSVQPVLVNGLATDAAAVDIGEGGSRHLLAKKKKNKKKGKGKTTTTTKKTTTKESPDKTVTKKKTVKKTVKDTPAGKKVTKKKTTKKTTEKTNKKGETKKKTTKKTTKSKRFVWKGRGKNGLKFKSKRPKKALKNGEIVYDADGVKCVATKKETDKIAFSQSADLHASAVAEAVEYLCNPPGDFSVSHLEEIFAEAEAAAFAHAAVKAKLKCKSKGKDTPETCVSYSATATAIAEATATAHAEAATEAIASCPCMTDVVIAAFASADLYIELVADASVTAEATVCVEGKSKGKDVAWEQCTTVIYAKLFAKALAHAATFGTCMSPEATAQLSVYVDADITKFNTPQCDVEPVCNGCDEE